MRLRPCIDIHDGRVKQIVGGSLTDRTDPRENFVSAMHADFFAGIYRTFDLPGGHIINLNREGEEGYAPSVDEVFLALRAWPKGMMVGGGINPKNAGYYLAAGASHCIVTSYIFREGKLLEEKLKEMESAVSRKNLVLDLSCRKDPDGHYYCVTDRWQKKTELAITEETLDTLAERCDEFLIHAADVEGKRGGIERDLVALLGNWTKKTHFPVTYAGGVHALSDIRTMRELAENVDVTVGSALDLFGGDLKLQELVSACTE